jgi:hypothetical protein
MTDLKPTKMKRYDFYENGTPHTKGLKLADAKEMVERYKRFFPNNEYYYMPTGMMA